MRTKSIAVAAALMPVGRGASQRQPTNFDQAAYITCKEAHAMNPEARKALAVYLAEHACALSRRGHSRRPVGAQIGLPGARRLHARARRLSVHRHRPRDRGGDEQAAQAAVTFLMFLSPLGGQAR